MTPQERLSKLFRDNPITPEEQAQYDAEALPLACSLVNGYITEHLDATQDEQVMWLPVGKLIPEIRASVEAHFRELGYEPIIKEDPPFDSSNEECQPVFFAHLKKSVK